MLLSDSYRKRMIKLSGAPVKILSEADKRNIIVSKLKVPEGLAIWAHHMSDKYSIWIASSAKDEYVESIDEDLEAPSGWPSQRLSSEEYISEHPDEIVKYAHELQEQYQHVLDWLTGRGGRVVHEDDKINFKELDLATALNRSDEWHSELKKIQGGRIDDEDGEVVMTLEDGFYWIRIGTRYCDKEGEAMGHCGSGRGILYSLRNNKYPYLTMDLDEEHKVVIQLRGRSNTRPKKEFHKHILPMLYSDRISFVNPAGYGPEDTFHIKDLEPSQIVELFTKKPSMLHGSGWVAMKLLSDEEFKKVANANWDKLNELVTNWSKIIKSQDTLRWLIEQKKKHKELPRPDPGHPIVEKSLTILRSGWYGVPIGLSNLKLLLSFEDEKKALLSSGIDNIRLSEESIQYIATSHPYFFEDVRSHETFFSLGKETVHKLLHDNIEIAKIAIDEMSVNPAKLIELIGEKMLRKIFLTSPQVFSWESFFDETRVKDKKHLLGHVVNERVFNQYILKYVFNDADPLTLNKLDVFNTIPLSVKKPKIFYKMISELPEYMNGLFMEVYFAIATNKEYSQIADYLVLNKTDLFTRAFGTVHNSLFYITQWKLSPKSINKLINIDISGGDIFKDFYPEYFEKMGFSKRQIMALVKGRPDYIDKDMIKKFEFPFKISGPSLIESLRNDYVTEKEVIETIDDVYGSKELIQLYKSNKSMFNSLKIVLKIGDINRLTRLTKSRWASFTKDGVKIRYSGWDDSDLTDLFTESGTAENIANYELDFNGYDFSFNDLSYAFDDLNEDNINNIKKTLKTFIENEEEKSDIDGMDISTLFDALQNPDEHFEDWDDSIVDDIKSSFNTAVEDAQRDADEGEYWELYTNPINELLGQEKWKTVKVINKDKKAESISMLEFFMDYGELEEFLDSAEEYEGSDDFVYGVNRANIEIHEIIKFSLAERGEELKIDIPYYGVNGDVKADSVNDRFADVFQGHL